MIVVPNCKGINCNLPDISKLDVAKRNTSANGTPVLSKRVRVETLLNWTKRFMLPAERNLTNDYISRGPNTWWVRLLSTAGVGTNQSRIVTVERFQLRLLHRPPYGLPRDSLETDPDSFRVCLLFPPFVMRQFFRNERNIAPNAEVRDLVESLDPVIPNVTMVIPLAVFSLAHLLTPFTG